MERKRSNNDIRPSLCARLLRLGDVLLVVAGVLVLVGCTSRRGPPVPPHLVGEARLPGFADIRSPGTLEDQTIYRSLVDSIDQEAAYYAEHTGETRPGRVGLLALSGGGANGAFGAGLLCGWSEAGARPTFKLVTGVSTGALIAPLAFLGSHYDDELRAAYTTVETSDILEENSPLLSLILGRQAVADTGPLQEMVAEMVDERVLEEIAREHHRGRRLLIATTNLDSQRPVIWDMGAIAASGNPGAAELFHKIMVASASIPVAFPPVYIEVAAGGETFEEMHVDGGLVVQTFLFGSSFSVVKLARERGVTPRPIDLYVIRNGNPSAEWEAMTPRLMPIAGRAINTLLKANGANDLLRLEAVAKRDGLNFQLAYIPGSIGIEPKEAFDREYMNRLFALSYEKARDGYPWLSKPLLSLYPKDDETAPGAGMEGGGTEQQ